MAMISLIEYMDRNDKEKILTFFPILEREMLFNINAYKLKLSIPLERIQRTAIPQEDNKADKKLDDFHKNLINVDTVYLFSKSEYDIFNQEKLVENDSWIYKRGSLFLTITNPLFYKGIIIQEAKCWLTSSGTHLMNYINYIDKNLANQYFNKK